MVNINTKRIQGNWREGYALDYHTLRSEFLGYDGAGHPQFNTTRSEIGELLYRLKYRSDRSVTNAIVETAVQFIRSWGIEADVIIPVLGCLNRP